MEGKMGPEVFSALNGSSEKWEVSSRGSPAYAAETLSAVLATIGLPGPALLGRVKYANQTSCAQQLNFLLFRSLVREEKDLGKWRPPRKGFIQQLCELAITLETSTYTCPACHGVSERLVADILT